MPQQTLAAWLREQFAGLTKRVRNRLTRTVDECIDRYGRVRSIQRGAVAADQWGEAKRGLQGSLDKLSPWVEVPPIFGVVMGRGPSYYFPPGIPQDVVQAKQQEFDEVADRGRLFLEELGRVLRATAPKGEPGRKPKYPRGLVSYVKKNRPRTAWGEVFRRCKERFPNVAYPKLNSFTRHMQRLIGE